MNIHFADLGIILVLLFFLVRGYSAGLILSLITIVVLIISLFLSTLYSGELSLFLSNWLFFLPESTLQVVSFSILFLLVFTVLNWLSKVTKILNKLPLIGSLNQALGALFGFFKGLIVVSLLLFILNFQTTSPDLKRYIEEGKLFGYFSGVAPAVFDVISEIIPIGGDFYTEFNEIIKQEVDKQIESLKESQNDS